MACESLPEAKVAEYQRVFNQADKNRDGAIQEQELGTCLQLLKLNPSPGKLKKILLEFDKDSDGQISFQEFVQLIRLVEEDLRFWQAAFRQFDADGNGFITKDELRQVMSEMGQNLNESDLVDMMNKADTSGDGKINYEEFLNVMSKFGSEEDDPQ